MMTYRLLMTVSKAVVLLLMHCLLLLPLFCKGFVFGPCFSLQYIMLCFVLQSSR